MAGEIRITPEEIRSGANTIAGDRDAIIEQVESVKRTIENVAAGWSGAAQGEFVDGFQALYPTLHDEVPKILTGITDQLNAAASALEETDTQLASSYRG